MAGAWNTHGFQNKIMEALNTLKIAGKSAQVEVCCWNLLWEQSFEVVIKDTGIE